MDRFKAGDRVRLREDHHLDVDDAVEHGDTATVVNTAGQRGLYEVKFDGFREIEIVEESGLEPTGSYTTLAT